ncbi:hypothetical protein ACFLU6_06715 [Acidobacteriota bacterium]
MNEERRIGKVVHEKGKYFVEVEGKREELAGGIIVEGRKIEDLVGQEVEVLYSEPRRFVVGLVAKEYGPILCYVRPPMPPMCYYPVDPWIYKGIEKEIRENLAKRFFEEGLLSEQNFEKLR